MSNTFIFNCILCNLFLFRLLKQIKSKVLIEKFANILPLVNQIVVFNSNPYKLMAMQRINLVLQV